MKKKKSNIGQYIYIGIFLLIGFLCGVSMGPLFDSVLTEDASFEAFLSVYAVFFVFLMLGMLLQTIIHEGGHLVFGLISGYKFNSFRIFSIMLLKEDGKFKIKRHSLAGTGGQCLMIPPEMKDGKFPVTLYNLGGAFMNLIFSAVAAVFYFLFSRQVYFAAFCAIFAIIGVGFALTNGIPLKVGTINNDGHNAFSLSKDPKALYSLWLQLTVNAQQTSKNAKRLKDLPEELFERPTDEEMKNSMVSALGVLACNRLMDRHEFEEADKLMAHYLEIESGIVGLHKALMICDRMYCELIGENRFNIIEEFRTKEQLKIMTAMKDFPSVLRTEYAYNLLALRNPEKAEKIKKRFQKIEKSYPHPADYQSEKELMEIAEERAKH